MASRFIVLLFLGALCVLSLNLTASPARAQTQAVHAHTSPGIAANGLCGLMYAESPLCPAHVFTASASVGYGYSESIEPVRGSHARLAGSLGVAWVPLESLALSLRFDGRRDTHPPDEDGPDSTMVGDPRLQVRLGRTLTRSTAIGGSVGLWMPGTRAPSLHPRATTVDLKLLGSYRAARSPWSLLGTLGFRWDNSAASAPSDLSRVRPGDRLSLNLSDSNAILWVVGVSRTIGKRGEAFLDLSGDWLVGKHAPSSLRQSPLRAILGGRYFLSDQLQFEATVGASLAQRPSLAVGAPLIPSEPRIYAAAGFRFGVPKSPRQTWSNQAGAAPAPITGLLPAAGLPPSQTISPRSASLTGTVLDAEGVPLSEARVELSLDGETREAISDSQGRYSFPDVPLGSVELTLSATGFTEQSLKITVGPGLGPLPAQRLELAAATGMLRCVTRTFASEPLAAVVSVHSGDGLEVAKGESNEQGLFEIQLPPGSYQVIITATGYRSHRRSVSVSTNGVAILNVDLREH